MYANGEWWGANGLAEARKPSNQPYHNGGWNYTFADGHAKWHKPSQTVARGVDYYDIWSSDNGYWTIDPND